ncbi:MAG: sce7726 family protein [Planctomycetota bacterium]
MRDCQIRQALRTHLVRRYATTDSGTLVIDELPICRHAARADLAVINGSLLGYEIKSERDTLRRLDSQMAAYDKVFEYATVVAANNHINELLRRVPAWWGVTEAHFSGDRVRLQRLREPGANLGQCPLSICQLLWRDEALDILKVRGLRTGTRGHTRRRLWEKIADAVPLDELRWMVVQRLKARGHWRAVASRT